MIRAARREDVDAVLRMVRALAAYEREPDAVRMTADDLAVALFTTPPAAHCLVAESRGAAAGTDAVPAVAGFALWYPTFSTWTGQAGMYLVDLFVRAEYRREGHGRALLTELARLCAHLGYQRLEWAVLDWNTPAHAFYRTIGADPTPEWTTWRLDAAGIGRLVHGVR